MVVSTALQVDPHTIDTLKSALDTVKQNDGRFTGNALWITDATMTNIYSEGDEMEDAGRRLRALQLSLEMLRAKRATLRQLLRSADDTILTLEAGCQPLMLHYGIPSLPEELLARVFELGSTDFPLDRFSITVSHVCRHFRTVALSTPSLWRRLFNNQNRDSLYTFISRSKATALEIFVDENIYDPWDILDLTAKVTASEFFAIVAQQSHRWGTFEHRHPNGFHTPDWSAAISSYRNLELPLLSSLTYSHGHTTGVQIPNPAEGDPFYAHWSTPRLVNVRGVSAIPHASVSKSLTSCDLLFDAGHSITLNMESLLAFLQSSLHLKQLSLAFQHVYLLPSIGHFSKVTLPNLQYLSLGFAACNSPNFVKTLVDNFLAANITEMFISLRTCSVQDTWGRPCEPRISDDTINTAAHIIRSIIPDENIYRTLCRITLSATHFFNFDGIVVCQLLAELASLHHLTLEAPGMFYAGWCPSYDGVAPLRSLSLKNCYNMPETFIECLFGLLKSGKKSEWQAFQKLEVQRCCGLSEMFLHGLREWLPGQLKYTL